MDPTDPHDKPTRKLPGAVPAGVGGEAFDVDRFLEDLRADPEPEPEPEPEPDPAPAGFRRLTRSREDRVIAGVAGGLGRYFRIDPILFRLAFALLIFAGGAGVVAYLAVWLFVPSQGGRAPVGGFDARRVLGRLTIAATLGILALIAAGAVFLAAAFGGGGWLAGLVLVAGVTMILAGLSGRARLARWVGAGALVVAIPLALVSAAGIDAEGGVGERHYRPASLADMRDSYELGMGELVVDLRDVELPEGRTDLDIEVGIGEAVVLVADDVCVSSRTELGAGETMVLGRRSGGVDVDVEWLDEDPAATGPRLMIDAEIGLGAFRVHNDELLERPWAAAGWSDDRWIDEGPPVLPENCGGRP